MGNAKHDRLGALVEIELSFLLYIYHRESKMFNIFINY